jgi:ribonuclease HIII
VKKKNPTANEIKVELYRELYKERTSQSDKDFDKLVDSYSRPEDALSYLRGRLGPRL